MMRTVLVNRRVSGQSPVQSYGGVVVGAWAINLWKSSLKYLTEKNNGKFSPQPPGSGARIQEIVVWYKKYC